MSAAVDAQAVPLGGRRVPEGMDDHADWQNLPLAPQPREPQDFGAVHTAVMRFRSELGDIKKLLTAVAPAVKGLIYATDAGEPRVTVLLTGTRDIERTFLISLLLNVHKETFTFLNCSGSNCPAKDFPRPSSRVVAHSDSTRLTSSEFARFRPEATGLLD